MKIKIGSQTDAADSAGNLCFSKLRNARLEVERSTMKWGLLKFDGFWIFRFAKWIKEQAIPREVKSYCKNVLHYLGSRNFDFIDDGVIDDEDMFESDDSLTIGEPSEDEDVSSAGSLFASTEEEEDEEEEQGE